MNFNIHLLNKCFRARKQKMMIKWAINQSMTEATSISRFCINLDRSTSARLHNHVSIKRKNISFMDLKHSLHSTPFYIESRTWC